MPDPGERDAATLAELRAKIDAIDEDVHRLLVERSSVIDALIRTKGTSAPGAAFRPGREADMMRRLIARHSGALPLTAVEHIWREIISTFTHMQAPFGVVVEAGADAAALRDAARFYFGFSVALREAADPAEVIEAVAASGADLGVIARDRRSGEAAWWRGLGGPGGPQIMALLPFIGVAGRPAATPAFVVSPPLSDPIPGEIALYAVRSAAADVGRLADALDGTVLGRADGDGTSDSLIAVAGPAEPSRIDRACAAAGIVAADVAAVGSVSRGIAVDGAESVLYARPRQPETTP